MIFSEVASAEFKSLRSRMPAELVYKSVVSRRMARTERVRWESSSLYSIFMSYR